MTRWELVKAAWSAARGKFGDGSLRVDVPAAFGSSGEVRVYDEAGSLLGSVAYASSGSRLVFEDGTLGPEHGSFGALAATVGTERVDPESPARMDGQLVMRRYAKQHWARQLAALYAGGDGKETISDMARRYGFPDFVIPDAKAELDKTGAAEGGFNLKEAKRRPRLEPRTKIHVVAPDSMDYMEGGVILDSERTKGGHKYLVLVDGSGEPVWLPDSAVAPTEAGNPPRTAARAREVPMIRLTYPEPRRTGTTFLNLLSSGQLRKDAVVMIKEGTPVANARVDESYARGIIERIEQGSARSVPKLEISAPGWAKNVVVNIMVPRYDIWLIEDVALTPLDQYKGFWVTTSDPVAEPFGNVGILLSLEGDESLIRFMKHGVGWNVMVPRDSVKPHYPASPSSWMEPQIMKGHRFMTNDIVKTREQPAEEFVITNDRLAYDTDNKTRMVQIKSLESGETREVLPTDLVFVGRHTGKGRRYEPHLRSDKLAPRSPRDAE